MFEMNPVKHHSLFLCGEKRYMATDESWYQVIICLLVPEWGTSNEYPQHMFSGSNKQIINIFFKKQPYLEIWN